MSDSETPRIAILTGMTASGKTALALEFARSHPEIEIINADSILVYRGMDIGSAKPTPQERAEIPHHLIDIRNPDESFNAGDFQRETETALKQIQDRHRRALIVGGTGFYLKALIYGLWESPKISPEEREAFAHSLQPETNEALHLRLLKKDPESAGRIGSNDRYRLVRALELIQFTGQTPTALQKEMPKKPDPRFKLFVVDRPKQELDGKIQSRAQQMIEQGLLEEARLLQERYPTSRALLSVGYSQALNFQAGKKPQGRKTDLTQESLLSEITLATRQLCKSQRTWFKSERSAHHFELDRDRDQLWKELKSIYE